MTDRFSRALPLILAHEGGYVDHPKDPGGATNQGITQRTYDEWRDYLGADRKGVRGISPDEVSQIYRARYWDAVKGDHLPDGLAYCVFDAAVNSGPARAVRWMQAALGVPADGVAGPQTLAAAQRCDVAGAIKSVCAARLAFMRSLKIWPTFGRGWAARVADIERASLTFAAGVTPAPAVAPHPVPKARGDVSVTAAAGALAKSGPGLAGAGSLAAGVAGLASGAGPVQWGIAAVMVIGAVCGAVWFLRGQMSRAAA